MPPDDTSNPTHTSNTCDQRASSQC